MLKRLIGSGGMGRVYEAQDTVMDRTVALKLISAQYAQDPDYRARLQREARIAGRLQDPHIVPIHGTGEIDGQLYVDMRLISGTDLDTLLENAGPLPAARAVSIVRQVAAALDAAHAAGVLHRDVKPGNIILAHDDFAYLVDFGIANAATDKKLTQMGDVLGTWAYMAPERFNGDAELTPRSDVYALACVLFEILTGTAPFTGEKTALVAGHLAGPIPKASAVSPAPRELDDVIARGMAKNPAERYSSAGEFAAAAERAAGWGEASRRAATAATAGPSTPLTAPIPANEPIYGAHHSTPPPESTPSTAPAAPRRKWILAAVASAVVVAVVAAIGVWQFTGDDSQTEADGPAAPTEAVDTAAEIDLSGLDTGDYRTEPLDMSRPPTLEEGRYLEASRLAEAVANPFEVDEALSYVYVAPAPDPALAASQISLTATPLVEPVLRKYGMVSGVLVLGLSKRLDDFNRDGGERVQILVASFPNADAAARAAADMDQTDFDVNPDNERTDIRDHPTTHAHYRPGLSSIAATMARGTLVTHVVTESSAGLDIAVLNERVARVLDLQVPPLDGLVSNNEEGLTYLKLDPNGMLKRAFTESDQPQPVVRRYFTIGPEAARLCAASTDMRRGWYQDAGVDRCTEAPGSFLLRTADEASALQLLQEWRELEDDAVARDIAGPDGVDNAYCYERTQKYWADDEDQRFRCAVVHDRYVARVFSAEEDDVLQRAAAQYAILVNSD